MTVLPLVIAPDPRLKNPSKPVKNVNDGIRSFMNDMLETMYERNGIGLAAVQVGVLKKIITIDVGYGSSRYSNNDEEKKPAPLFLVNPEIVKLSEEMSVYEEGCLSFPTYYAEIARHEKVTVKFLDYNGKKQTIDADGLLAICLQHEIDHLNGIVFVDHISRIKRDIILKKLRKSKL